MTHVLLSRATEGCSVQNSTLNNTEYSLYYTVQRTLQLPRRWAIIIITNPEISATTLIVAQTFFVLYNCLKLFLDHKFYATKTLHPWTLSICVSHSWIRRCKWSIEYELGFFSFLLPQFIQQLLYRSPRFETMGQVPVEGTLMLKLILSYRSLV